ACRRRSPGPCPDRRRRRARCGWSSAREWLLSIHEATLAWLRRERFSKTARSRPGHQEAGRHGRHAAAPPESGRRFAHDGLERPAEGSQAVEPDVEADVRDAATRRAEEEHRALDAPPLEVPVWRLAERRAKRADEVRVGHSRDPREARDTERLRKRAVHRVSRAQHPTVALLDRSTHPAIFTV